MSFCVDPPKVACERGMTGREVEQWVPPPLEWLKVNTDAAFKEGAAALAMVVRDSCGKVLLLQTKLETAHSPMEAELKALSWALESVVSMSWRNLIWSSDAQFMVKEINSNSDPCEWNTRYMVLSCRELLSSNGWILGWNARDSNQLADIAAKFSLSSISSFSFSGEVDLCSSLPASIIDVAFKDQAFISLSL